MKNYINSGILYQYGATIAGNLAVVPAGVNYAWTSAYLPKLQSEENTSIDLTHDDASWCAIMPFLGGPLGAIIAAAMVDRLGRKKTILALTPLIAPSFILIALTNSIWAISAARAVIGIADGMVFTVLPMYVGEVTDPSRREALSSLMSLSLIIGHVLINSIGPYTSIMVSSFIFVALAIFQFIWFCIMPESPYFLIKKGRLEEAEKNLKVFRGTNDVKEEFEELCKAVSRQEGSKPAKTLDLVTVPSNRKACIIFLILCFANKFSGKIPVVLYTSDIFKEAGSSLDPSHSTIIYCCVEFCSIIFAISLIKKFGKRSLFIVSAVGTCLTLFTLATHFYLKDFYALYPDTMGWLPLVSLFSFIIFFSIGLNYGQVTVLSELFPTNVKGAALCLADCVSVIMATATSKFFQMTRDYFGMHVPFFCFATCCATSLYFIIRFVPETKGKTLEEIQLYLIGEEKAEKDPENPR